MRGMPDEQIWRGCAPFCGLCAHSYLWLHPLVQSAVRPLCPPAAALTTLANMLSGLNATRHPVHKAAKPAPASQTNSAREHNVCAIKPLKSVRGSPTRLSHHRDHRDNTRRITRLGKKPFPPEQIVPCVSAITRQVQSRTRNTCITMPAQACQPILNSHRGPDVSSTALP